MEQQAIVTNRYRIISRLCSGGMADIFLGVQVDQHVLDRLVVIKKVHNGDDPEQDSTAMFADEARIISTLSHPHVVQIFDFTEDIDTFILVMEYIDGENLGYILGELRRRNIGMPLPIVFKLMDQALEALQYIHTAVSRTGEPLNIVHRDLDPRNLMTDRNGYLKVIDFGVAKAVVQTELTAPGLFKGKLSHVAPEIFTQSDIDHRADIYSIGLVLYEMVAGQKPYHFGKDTVLVDTIKHIVDDPIPRPSSVNPNVPPELDALILRTCAKKRDARFQSAAALQEALNVTSKKLGIAAATNAEIKQWFCKTFEERLAKRQLFENQTLQQAKQELELVQTSLSSRPSLIPGSVSVTATEQLPDCRVLGPDTGNGMTFPSMHDDGSGNTFTNRPPVSMADLSGSTGRRSISSPSGGENRDSLMSHGSAGMDPMQTDDDTGDFRDVSRGRIFKIIASTAALVLAVIGAIYVFALSDRPRPITSFPEPKPVAVQKRSDATMVSRPAPSVATPPSSEKETIASPTELQPPSEPAAAPPVIGSPAAAEKPTDTWSKQPGPTGNWLKKKKKWGKEYTDTRDIETGDAPSEIASVTPSSAPAPIGSANTVAPAHHSAAALYDEDTVFSTKKKPIAKTPASPSTRPDDAPHAAPTQNTPLRDTAADWLSGTGSWSGATVAQKGCGNCHSVNPTSKTTSQWEYFFSHDRHRKHGNLRRLFSKEELERVQSHLMSASEKQNKKRSGIAGVR